MNLQPILEANPTKRESLEIQKQSLKLNQKVDHLLDNNTSNALLLNDRELQQYSLYDLKAVAKRTYPNERINICGWKSINNAPIQIGKSTDDKVRYSNLWRCGSVWTCPTCAYKIMKVRQAEIYHILKSKKDQGKQIYFLTLTHRHTKDNSLESIIDSLRKTWRKLSKTSKHQSLFSDIDYIKTLEIKKSKSSGWHPHLHIVIISDKNLDYVQEKINSFIEDWIFQTGSDEVGQVFKQANTNGIANYIAKYDLSQELTTGQMKGGKGQTYLQMLKDLEQTGEAEIYYQLQEYLQATKNKKQFTFSRGLKKSVMTDKQITKLKDNVIEIIASIEIKAWHQIYNLHLEGNVLKFAEHLGIDGIYAYLIGKIPNLIKKDKLIFLE